MKMNYIAEMPDFINDRVVTIGKITAIEEAFEKSDRGCSKKSKCNSVGVTGYRCVL